MRLIHPRVDDVSVDVAYDLTDRPRREDRPWVVMSMISTADGAVSLEGNSSLLGGPTDREVFLHLHRSADSVLVGAETVRQDVYTPLAAHQVLVVVSKTGDLGRNATALTVAGNTRIVGGDVRDIVLDLPGRLCVLEGGPSLNAQMLTADLVDEICLTIAPRFVSGASQRIAAGPLALREPWDLAHIATDDGFVFLRYLRASSGN
ncbi:MAG: dihydrofolate reductase family protein [Actinobacteria bacterium]|nr:dihydrofolate reductase family protein [Actinomycetota bacterium]